MTSSVAQNTLLSAAKSAAAQAAAGATTASLSASSSASIGWQTAAATAGRAGINATEAWRDYSGAGIKVGIYDDGGFGIGKHATAVAGVIVGSGLGTGAPVGVAYGATATFSTVIGQDVMTIAARLAGQRDHDVVNHSWGYASPFAADASKAGYKELVATFTDATSFGRGGLGTVITVAAGNYKASGTDVNTSNLANDRHVVTVGAITSEGDLTDYSARGAAVLVAAPSSGGTKTGVLTADLAGSQGYSEGDVTDRFGGTSAATPQVAGISALILDANGSLGWRDVKTILALSSAPVAAAGGVKNGDVHWNGAGHVFSNDVGFGLVDARAATRLAETWSGSATSVNERALSATISQNTQIKDATTTNLQFKLAAGVEVESISLALDAYHGRVSDLTIELVSPSGTVSRLLEGSNGGGTLGAWTLTSNAFLGEESGGTWTVRVVDGKAGMAGFVNSAKLTVNGAQSTSDERFVFTDSFAESGNGTLKLAEAKAGGFDHINAAAVTSDSIINLQAGSTSWIDGRSVVIEKGSVFEAAYGGDGHDTLTGNAEANLLWGGRGNDTLSGGAGDDILLPGTGRNVVDGGTGIDTLRLSGDRADWKLSIDSVNDMIRFEATSTLGDHNVVRSVERLVFDDTVLAFDIDQHAGAAYRLYEAAFDRAPDVGGVTYWVRQLDGGAQLKEVALHFTQSKEFDTLYGNSVSDRDFVNLLYHNVLERAPEAEGFNYWVEKLADHHMDKADVLLQFSESAENVHNVEHAIASGIVLDNNYLSL